MTTGKGFLRAWPAGFSPGNAAQIEGAALPSPRSFDSAPRPRGAPLRMTDEKAHFSFPNSPSAGVGERPPASRETPFRAEQIGNGVASASACPNGVWARGKTPQKLRHPERRRARRSFLRKGPPSRVEGPWSLFLVVMTTGKGFFRAWPAGFSSGNAAQIEGAALPSPRSFDSAPCPRGAPLRMTDEKAHSSSSCFPQNSVSR